MASFPPVTMTTEGLNMIAKASSGNSQDRLIITKVKLGDGVSEGNIRDYTDVISSKKEVTLAEWEDRGDGRFRYTFIYNNEGVKTGFYHREIGLFAKNGDSGTEKLIAYSNAGSYPGYIDDETKEIPYQRLMINIGVGDTDNVSGQVDVSNAVTIEMLKEELKKYLPLSGGTLTGILNASGHNITANNFIGMASRAGDVTGGYYKPEEAFPTNEFRTKIFGTNADDWSLHLIPFRTKMPDGDSNHAGFAFAAGDTQGFIQASYIGPKVVIGAGNQDNINWTKQLAFKDSSILNSIEVESNTYLKVTKGDGSTQRITVPYANRTEDTVGFYGTGSENFPTENFRTNIFGINDWSGHIKGFNCKTPDGSINHAGLAFGSRDTHGFIQMKYDVGTVWVGAGNNDKINWKKQLAFKDDIPSTVSMSLNTLSKNNSNYWIKNIDGLITQVTEIDLNGQREIDVQFPISFTQKCLFLDVEIINIEKDTSINCNFHTVEKTLDGAKLLKVGTGSPKKIVVKVIGI